MESWPVWSSLASCQAGVRSRWDPSAASLRSNEIGYLGVAVWEAGLSTPERSG
jgi:hypothetical protein